MFPRVTDRRGRQAGATATDSEGPGATGGQGSPRLSHSSALPPTGCLAVGGNTTNCSTVLAPHPVMGDPQPGSDPGGWAPSSQTPSGGLGWSNLEEVPQWWGRSCAKLGVCLVLGARAPAPS